MKKRSFGPLVNSPGRTRVVLVKRCRAQTARAANPWALRPSLMAIKKGKNGIGTSARRQAGLEAA